MKPKSETVTLWDDVLSESRAMRSSCLSLACRHMYSSNSTNVSKKKTAFICHLEGGGRR